MGKLDDTGRQTSSQQAQVILSQFIATKYTQTVL